jgi:hypothetical protein
VVVWSKLGFVEREGFCNLSNGLCFATYVVTVLSPFDVDFRACSEFGGEVFEGDCCEAEGVEQRCEGEGGEFHSCNWLIFFCSECCEVDRFLF